MTNVKLLTLVVKDRLTAVAEEICGIVERTIEAEISQYKQEADRQRKLLDAVLQPRVELVRRDDILDLSLGPSEHHHYEQDWSKRGPERPIVWTVSEFKREEEERQTSEEWLDCPKLGEVVPNDLGQNQTLSSHGSQSQESGDGYECPPSDISNYGKIATQASAVAREVSEPARDHQLLSSDACGADSEVDEKERDSSQGKRDQELGTSLRHTVSKGCTKRETHPTKTVLLRICVLLYPHMHVLSRNVSMKSPSKKLKVPFGLQEAEFIKLLRFSFPELGNKPFDALKVDSKRSLCPLNLKRFTPEQIVTSACLGRSALYIRLKENPEEHGTSSSSPQLQQPEDVSPLGFCDIDHSRSPTLNHPGFQSFVQGCGRGRQFTLRICVITNPQIDMLTTSVSKRYPVKKLKVHYGLQEAEFLKLLISSYPQLSDKSFDVLKVDKSRRLHRVKIDRFIPEEIVLSSCLGRSALYIRLKKQTEQPIGKGRQSTTDVEPVALTLEGDGNQTIGSTCSPACETSDPDHIHTQPSDPEPVFTEENRREDAAPSTLKEGGKKGGRMLLSALGPISDSEGHVTEGDDREADSDWRQSEGTRPDSDTHKAHARTGKRPKVLKRPKTRKSTRRWKSLTGSKSINFTCKVCEITLLTVRALLQHALVHAGDAEQICGFCGKHLGSDENLADHLKPHTTEKSYKCDKCHKRFSTKANLLYHFRTHTGEKPYLCTKCGKSYRGCSTFLRHKKTHIEEKIHECKECGKRYGHVVLLKIHMRCHIGYNTYICDICGLKLSNKNRFIYHMRVHNGEKPYRCNECGKCFRDNGTMARHVKTHSEEKPYSCSECGKVFRNRTAVKFHMRSHSDEKPFVCEYCNRGFRRFEHLKVHKRTHTGEKPYKCNICDKAFTQSHCLKEHSKIH